MSSHCPKFKVGEVVPVGSLFLPVDTTDDLSILSLDQFNYYTDIGEDLPILTIRSGMKNDIYNDQWLLAFGRVTAESGVSGIAFSNQVSSGELHISPSYAHPTNVPGISVVNCWERKNMSNSYIGLLDLTGNRPTIKLLHFLYCYSEPVIQQVSKSPGTSDNWPIRDEMLKHPGHISIITVKGILFLNPDTLELTERYNPVINAIVTDENLTDNYQDSGDMRIIATKIVEACKAAAINAVSGSDRAAVAAALDALLRTSV